MENEELKKKIDELLELVTPENIAALSDEDLAKLKAVIDRISE